MAAIVQRPFAGAAVADQAASARTAYKGSHRMRSTTRQRIGRTVSTVLLALIVGAVVVPWLAGWHSYLVESGSMGKAAPTGSLVAMRPVTDASVTVGQVVLLHRGNGTPVLHRVIERKLDGDRVLVRTKGDANLSADPLFYPVPKTVLTPALVVPKIGFAVPFLRSRVGISAMVAVAGLLLIQSALRRRPDAATA
jgi:signal peptidase I